MNQNCQIIRARLPGYQELQEIGLNLQGIITSIQPWFPRQEESGKAKIVDCKGDWLSLGGIDLQINGALGYSFTDLATVEPLEKIAGFLANQGIDGFCPTLITTTREKIARSLKIISEYMAKQKPDYAQVLGVHLEGPFLNPLKKGAHPSEYLLPLTLENVKAVLGDYEKIVKIITLAPELDATRQIIPYLVNKGIVVSLGHSLANSQQAKQAFAQGATMITHAFNAMPSLHHRAPGLLGEAIIHPEVKCGLIADGHHVSPTMIQILLQASHYSQGVFLVSDALAPLGLLEGRYPWDKRTIVVKEGTARLEDGTLSGTTLPLLAGVENLLQWGICDLPQAIALATNSPREAISLPTIEVGQPAKFRRWRWHPHSKILNFSRISL